mmetsp:Transcript_28286/g.91539  ORF Transcript_28286/g.91539 Transcript_28286/m.91539 type:complete len:387 (-) Transcript_28286:210-1370(-)
MCASSAWMRSTSSDGWYAGAELATPLLLLLPAAPVAPVASNGASSPDATLASAGPGPARSAEMDSMRRMNSWRSVLDTDTASIRRPRLATMRSLMALVNLTPLHLSLSSSMASFTREYSSCSLARYALARSTWSSASEMSSGNRCVRRARLASAVSRDTAASTRDSMSFTLVRASYQRCCHPSAGSDARPRRRSKSCCTSTAPCSEATADSCSSAVATFCSSLITSGTAGGSSSPFAGPCPSSMPSITVSMCFSRPASVSRAFRRCSARRSYTAGSKKSGDSLPSSVVAAPSRSDSKVRRACCRDVWFRSAAWYSSYATDNESSTPCACTSSCPSSREHLALSVALSPNTMNECDLTCSNKSRSDATNSSCPIPLAMSPIMLDSVS